MPTYLMHCQYCGHKWEYTVYFSIKDKQIKCNRCNDSNIKHKPLDEVINDKDVFGYNKEE